MQSTEPRDRVKGNGGVQLPPGMTQEEADRLVREADEKANQKEND